MKFYFLFTILFISTQTFAQNTLPEKFRVKDAAIGPLLELKEDSTFFIQAGNCGGIKNYSGTFTYVRDTLLLTLVKEEWFHKPDYEYHEDESCNDNNYFIFHRFFRNGDDLYFYVELEKAWLGPLSKVNKN